VNSAIDVDAAVLKRYGFTG